MTEKQLIENGPILIDLDLRYESSVSERQHQQDHIVDCIMCYADEINNLLNIDQKVSIPIFVFEKEGVNCLEK